MGRPWAPPLRADALNILLVSDMHHGRRAFTTDAMNNAARSFDRLAAKAHRIIDIGDGIHWRRAEDLAKDNAQWLSWVNARRAATGKPFDAIAGNHCLQSYGAPYPRRSGDQWAADAGLPSRNKVIDHEDWLRLILVTPIFQGYSTETNGHAPMVLNPDELAWIRAQAAATPNRRVYVFFHAPIQYGGHMNWEDARAAIAMEPNIVAWVSGHRHMDPATDARAFMNLTYDGKTVHAINLPTFGGICGAVGDDRWGQPFHSTMMSILPEGGVELRVFEHMSHTWVPYLGNYVCKLPAIT